MANNLTLTGATFAAGEAAFGQRLTGGYGTGPTVSLAYPFTIEARVTITSTASGPFVAAGLDNGPWVGVAGGKLAGDGYFFDNYYPALADGQPHHVAVVYVSPTERYICADGAIGSDSGGSSSTGQALSSPIRVANLTYGSSTSAFQFPGTVDEVRVSSVARYSGAAGNGSYTVPSGPFTSDANTVALYHASMETARTVRLQACKSRRTTPAIVYSPANWNVASTAATTINGGAYARAVTSDPNPVLNFDVSKMVPSAMSQIVWRIDGGSWTVVDIAATIACAASSDTSAQAKHLLEWAVKATTEFQVPSQPGQRWDPSNGPNTAVVFTGLTLVAGATVSAPRQASLRGAVLGDSITEGYLTLNGTAATDVLRSDSQRGWALDLRRHLGSEIGVVGFGGQGWDSGGVGSVPSLPNTYASVYSGAPRSFAGLDFVLLAEGTNGTTTSANVTAVLNGILSVAPPSCQIFVLRPFNGAAAAALQAGLAACSNPARIAYVDTTGTDITGVDGTHPSASANLITNGPLILGPKRGPVS